MCYDAKIQNIRWFGNQNSSFGYQICNKVSILMLLETQVSLHVLTFCGGNAFVWRRWHSRQGLLVLPLRPIDKMIVPVWDCQRGLMGLSNGLMATSNGPNEDLMKALIDVKNWRKRWRRYCSKVSLHVLFCWHSDFSAVAWWESIVWSELF